MSQVDKEVFQTGALLLIPQIPLKVVSKLSFLPSESLTENNVVMAIGKS